ncbi:hypothetical protein N473_08820 [Pseudoalteromonas luteoviolacea CPMOR-1]|uniref:Uncharacterized protein n=1 Tax=Pseudoalteromonas luteoviolacea CPMOR-1 TaxID=1365248 RepID=A0A167MIU9_9GAMM|nr:hypothetical protein [Pseudoalteromonas luteoviolacea]KZN66483.1 hypothetical protein N473_08820 [Pseudoalteromonas luteoviolacea CPMOR-1]
MDLSPVMDGLILLLSGLIILLFAFGKLFPDVLKHEKWHGLAMPLRIIGGAISIISVLSFF